MAADRQHDSTVIAAGGDVYLTIIDMLIISRLVADGNKSRGG